MIILLKNIKFIVSRINIVIVVITLLLVSNNILAQTDSAKVNYSFILAADRGDVKAVNQFILKKNVNINYRDADGNTPLFYAVNNGHEEVVKTLLYYGADPNIGSFDGFTPLMNTALQGNFDMAQLLLYDSRTKLDIYDVNNCTALHYASYYDNIYIADMLIYYGASTILKAKYKSSPLLLASYSGDTALAQILINAGNLIHLKNSKGYSPMSIAIQNDDSVLFDFYFEQLKDKKTESEDWNEFLKVAIKHENSYATDILMKFFQKGVYEMKNSNKLYVEAYHLENYSLINEFKKFGYKINWKPILNSIHACFSTSFNKDDYTSFLRIGVDEVRYQTSVSLFYGFRFGQHAIRKEVDDNIFYQYWEHRNIIGFQLKKYLYVLNSSKFIIKPYISADFQWHFINYNGTTATESGIFTFAPELGMSFRYQLLLIEFAYQYNDFKILDNTTHRIKVGVGIHIPFYQKSKKYYPLWL
jgi:ankyrin repeat protein